MPRRPLIVCLALPLAAACGPERPAAPPAPGPRLVAGLDRWLERWPAAVLDAPVDRLDETQRAVIDRLIAAARAVDRVYLLQSARDNPEQRERLERIPGPERDAALALFDLNYGLYDRRRPGRALLAGAPPAPPGAGFYPPDLSPDEWERFLSAHPDREAELIAETSIVVRDQHGLTGVPYARAFSRDLRRAAEEVGRAAALTRSDTLRRYLSALGRAMTRDDFREADRLWLDLAGPVLFAAGPHPTGEDRLFGLKGSYEALVALVSPDGAARREALARSLSGGRAGGRGHPERAVLIADLLFAAGAARAGGLPVAVELPYDPAPGRTRLLVFANVARAKCRLLLRPIAASLVPDAGVPTEEALVDLVVLHALAHALDASLRDPAGLRELRETFPVLAEARAGLAAATALSRTRGAAESRAVYLPWLLHRLSGGGDGARAARLQLLLLAEQRLARLQAGAGRLVTGGGAWVEGLARAAARVGAALAAHDYDAARSLVEAADDLRAGRVAARLEQLPVDLRARFPAAGETPPTGAIRRARRTRAEP